MEEKRNKKPSTIVKKTKEEFVMTLSNYEARIIAIIRSLQAFESCDISADKEGKVDSYIVTRKYKEILVEE